MNAATDRTKSHAAQKWRRMLGFAILLGGAVVLLQDLLRAFPIDDPRMRGALLGGSVAALATALGTLPVLISQQFSQLDHARTHSRLDGAQRIAQARGDLALR